MLWHSFIKIGRWLYYHFRDATSGTKLFISNCGGIYALFKISYPFTSQKSCHNATIGKCFGACTQDENPEDYNARALQVIQKYGFDHQTIAITDKGRTIDEKSVILIKNGVLEGYGFLNLNYQLNHLNILENTITPLKNSLENRHLIQQYYRRFKAKKIISLAE